MKKETNLTEIKNILKDFLHMPVEETEYSPIVVQHPIFESGISYVNNKMTDIMTPEGFAAVAKQVEEDIDKIDDVFGCVNILRQSYYLTFLKFAKESLSLSDFSMLLGKFWTEEENPNGDVNVPVSLSARWFKSADKRVLMYDDEYKTYKDLPEAFTAYRGITPGRNPDGMSWTRDLSKADWFSRRFGDGYVLEGIANKKDVLAFFSRRGEEEVVIEAKKVKNKKEI